MKVRFLEGREMPALKRYIEKDEIVDLPDEEANELVTRGIAKETESNLKKLHFPKKIKNNLPMLMVGVISLTVGYFGLRQIDPSFGNYTIDFFLLGKIVLWIMVIIGGVFVTGFIGEMFTEEKSKKDFISIDKNERSRSQKQSELTSKQQLRVLQDEVAGLKSKLDCKDRINEGEGEQSEIPTTASV